MQSIAMRISSSKTW